MCICVVYTEVTYLIIDIIKFTIYAIELRFMMLPILHSTFYFNNYCYIMNNEHINHSNNIRIIN